MRLLPAALLLLSLPAWAVPLTLNHSGRVLDANGDPVEGLHAMTVRLYATPTGTTAAFTEVQNVTLTNGYFALTIGAVTALDDALFDDDTVYVSLQIDQGSELPGRILLHAVPYALRADTSTNVSGGIVDATEIRVDGQTVVDGDGGLHGSSLSIDGTTVITSDGTINATSIQIDGQTVIDGSGTLTASVSWDDIDDKPAGIDDGDDDTLADLAISCTSDQLALYDGNAWQCADFEIDASQIVTGTVAAQRLPIGTGAGTVAAGTHAHAAADVTSGTLDIARIPVGTTAGTVAAGVHVHSGADVTTGTVAVARLPVGTSAGTVAAGDHKHSAADLTSGTIPDARLPAGLAAISALQCSTGQSPTWSGSTWGCAAPTTPISALVDGIQGTVKLCGVLDNSSSGCVPATAFPLVCLRDTAEVGNNGTQEQFSGWVSPAAYWSGNTTGWIGSGRGTTGQCDHGVLMFRPTDTGKGDPSHLHHCAMSDGSTVGCRYPTDGWPVVCQRTDSSPDTNRGGFMPVAAHFTGSEWWGTARGSGGRCTDGVWFWNWQ